MTGCGCLLVIGALIAMIAVFIFGSTDPGEPIVSIVGLALSAVVALPTLSRARTLARS